MSNESTGSGVGFCGLLFFLFLGLRLGEVIDWSYWWVAAPLWMPLAIVLIILIGSLVICGVIAGIVFAVEALRDKG